METKPIDKAFMAPALPCNPTPFLNRMSELVAQNHDAVQSPQFKANLWVLLAITYGDLFMVDSYYEFNEIKKQLEQ